MLTLTTKKMKKVRFNPIERQLEQEIVEMLIQKGKVAAMRLYIDRSGARVREAKLAIDRLSREIEPGQAS